jgi:hypothetical protein
MVYALTLYKMLMGSSILLSATTISLILSFTLPRWQNTEKAAIVIYACALPSSLALVHHVLSSLFSLSDVLSFQTRQSTKLSVIATCKQISSTTNLLCLAFLAILVTSFGFVVLVQSVVELTPLDGIAQSIAEGSVAAATGFRDSLASNALILQALLQITQGIVLGWIFAIAAQAAHLATTLEYGFERVGIIVHVDVEQGDPHFTLSDDECDEDEDK